MPDDRFWMTARFDSTCAECDEPIQRGERFVFDKVARKGYCASCGEDLQGPDPLKDEEDF